MYTIAKITSHPTADFAAEELKKYLRMMLTRGGEVPIAYDPGAKEGFRIGLMADFGLDMSDADDIALDDIVYYDCDEKGGVIAGSNPIAMLIAVYRYLRSQGCRWLFPGVDGERIPLRTGLTPAKYRKLADHRYRGQCNEGAEFQTNMLETIDFTPKIGMNTYMLEFDIPFCYYNSYYTHRQNDVRPPEPVGNDTVLQWKRQCEVEIQKRGLHFHDMGHGWTAEPFGLDSKQRGDLPPVPEEVKPYLAEIGGERRFWNRIIDTNVCMSNPKVRDIMAKYIADYAEKQNNVDFLHIWLADGVRNHCECEECRKKTAPDWYVMLLNDIDAELTKRGLGTHLVFIVYTETFWPPVEARIANPKRFTMLYAPIFRKYTETYATEPDMSQLTPFNLNNNVNPRGMAGTLAYLVAWKKLWDGDCFCYEYHFWRHEALDPSGIYLSKLLHDDVVGLKQNGLHGIVEDGSQRSYFPTGLPFYCYGETLFDRDRTFEDLVEDYFSAAFGPDWKKAYEYLCAVRDALPFAWFSHETPAEDNPKIAASAAALPAVTAAFREVLKEHNSSEVRVETVSWRLLGCFCDYADMLADAAAKKASGDLAGAHEAFVKLHDEFARREVYIERWYDQYNIMNPLTGFFAAPKN